MRRINGSTWNRSEKDTASLRETVDCAPDACVFRKGELVALVFCDAKRPVNSWHLYLAVDGGQRTPTIDEIIDAREVLLPGIEDYAVTLCKGLDLPVLHLWELREPGWAREHLQ